MPSERAGPCWQWQHQDISAHLWRVVYDDGLVQITAQHRQILQVVALDQDTAVPEDAVPYQSPARPTRSDFAEGHLTPSGLVDRLRQLISDAAQDEHPEHAQWFGGPV